ncbi:U3 small nucleolar ribonucleoprotein protein MPP10 [Megalops cyprinoides]|uniref:U3 small nucleolar ribonucleoprotein protein MPP10 n=1 Tax=Megalops cyprinoides TaxID=118141 RepID=UPI001864B3EE|nr:U3 small nucleolar ribonucleoprotein protein MPP10 [Megalops cyprinoides]
MMADGDVSGTLDSCLKLLSSNTVHPETFLSFQNGLAADFTSLTKTLYDLLKAHEPKGTNGSPLEQLVVENFDEEQIWQELELQNTAVVKHFDAVVNVAVSDMTINLMVEEEDEIRDEGEVDEENNVDLEEEMSGDDMEEEGEEEPDLPDSSANGEEKFTDEDSDVDFDVDKLEKKVKQTKWKAQRQTGPSSEVDDRFFKLSEMEAFLEDVEKKEGKKDESDSEVDYFQDLPSGEEDELDLEEGTISKGKKKPSKSSRNLKYKDFFDPVEGEFAERDQEEDEDLGSEEDDGSEAGMQEGADEEDEEDLDEDEDDSIEEDENEDGQKARENVRKVRFDLSDDSEGEDMEDIFGGKSAETTETKSSFEKRQEKMAGKIQELEKAALAEKPWQLTGEVTGQTRPENSLLEEDLAFDQAARMAPTITEETTMQLEDIIKQRIKDQAWDDVVRKEKPKEDVFEYKKRLTLDHEKSKLSLAEVYEQEYLKQAQQKTEEEENPAHVEIQKLMDSLFLKLDALSNFHFTPKPPVPEVKVVSNLPSITMEEVAPVSASNATLLAPEEIKEKNKAGAVIGDSEKTATDKKRDRRKKKKLKRLRLQEKEKRKKLREASKAVDGKKPTKAEVAENLKKLTKGGKATVLKDEGKDKALRSSQAFFSQLQDQVKSQIKGAKDQSAKKKKQKEISSSKLKL